MNAKGLTVLPFALIATFARADFQTSATGYVGTNMLSPQGKSGLDYGQKTTSSIDIVAQEQTSRPGYTSDARARFQVLTEMGRIHAKGETYATHAYESDPPGTAGGIAYLRPNFGDFTNQGGPLRGDAYAGGSWYDTLHVESSTLDFGARAQFRVSLTLHATIDKYAPRASTQTTANLNSFFDSDGRTLQITGTSSTVTGSFLVDTYVGRNAGIGAILDLRAITSITTDGTASYSNIDAWNTGTFTVESLTPGVTYTTDSGYLYQPVPEPASLAALGLGAVAMFRRRKRA